MQAGGHEFDSRILHWDYGLCVAQSVFCILGKFFPNIQKNAPLGIRHSDEMRSILELLDKEKSDKLCQIYATKKHPTARNL